MRFELSTDAKKEVSSTLQDYVPPWRREQKEETPTEKIEPHYFSTYKERWKQTPADDGIKGRWEGNKGEGKYIPFSEEAQAKLKEHGVDGIEYHNAVVDFSPVSLEEVTIEMTSVRLSYKDGDQHIAGNFENADIKCAELWNKQGKNDRIDWSHTDVRDYREQNKLTWHECNDMKTCLLVPSEIHSACGHLGGCGECARRDNLQSGGGFDD